MENKEIEYLEVDDLRDKNESDEKLKNEVDVNFKKEMKFHHINIFLVILAIIQILFPIALYFYFVYLDVYDDECHHGHITNYEGE